MNGRRKHRRSGRTNMNKLSFIKTFVLSCCIGLLSIFAQNAQAATLTWDGGGVTNNWSEAANWSGDVAPQFTDSVIFDSTSTKDVVIDFIPFNTFPLRFEMRAGYTGAISQGTTNLTVTSDFIQAAGVFIGGSGTLDFDNFTVSGGTFTASNGTTEISGPFSVSGTGVFEHNNGTVVFNSAGSANVLTVEDFFNVQITASANSQSLGINPGDTLRINGTLTLTNGQLAGTGTIEALGPVSIASTFDGGDGLLLVSGNSVRTITIPGQAQMPRLTVNAPNTTINTGGFGTVNFRTTDIQNVSSITNGSLPFFFGNSFSYTQSGGTFIGGTGSFTFNNSFTVSGGTFTTSSSTTVFAGNFTISGTGSFDHNNGTVFFTRTNNVDVLTTEEFHNLIIESTLANSFTIASGDTLRAVGILSLNDGQTSGGQFEPLGNMTVGAAFDGGTSSILFSGTNAQTFTNSGGVNPTGTWTVNKSSGSVNLASDLDLSNGTANLVLTTGTITTGANTVICGTRVITRTIGFVNGNLRRTYTSAGSQQFPVGTVNGYSPATINATAGTFGVTTTFTVGSRNGTMPGASAPHSLAKYWSLTPSVGGIATANLRFDYLQTDVPALASEAAFTFLRRTGMTTSNVGVTSLNTTSNFATLNNVSTFSDWTLGLLTTTSANVVVGGRVLTETGRGVSRARVSMVDSDGNIRTAMTNPFGYYRFDGVSVGETYVITVGSKSYEFAIPSRIITVADGVNDIDFTANQ